ncbi:MAG: hypothetical protein JJU00_11680 [Opitutales bacterium]|nr:hypothetical protein [Opitutales bacterium]
MRIPNTLRAAGALALSTAALHGGFAEPPVLLHGKVLHRGDGYELLLQEGSLEWSVTPHGDAPPFTLETALQPVGDTFSYRLEIPVERVPGGFTVHAAIEAAADPAPVALGQPAVDGHGAQILLADGSEADPVFHYAEADRGKILRLDLLLTHPFEDTSGDGLPDWWAELHSLDPFDPTTATTDATGDGIENVRHYQMGTNPNVFFATYAAWAADHALTGDDAAPGADPDGDGVKNLIEFLLDTDPNVPDRSLAAKRLRSDPATSADDPALHLEWAQPAVPRWGLEIIVESSPDMIEWSPVRTIQLTESTDINELIVPEESGGGRYFRLAVRKVE